MFLEVDMLLQFLGNIFGIFGIKRLTLDIDNLPTSMPSPLS